MSAAAELYRNLCGVKTRNGPDRHLYRTLRCFPKGSRHTDTGHSSWEIGDIIHIVFTDADFLLYLSGNGADRHTAAAEHLDILHDPCLHFQSAQRIHFKKLLVQFIDSGTGSCTFPCRMEGMVIGIGIAEAARIRRKAHISSFCNVFIRI